MIGHALEVLEFERVLERVSHRASSEVGRRRILALRPSSDPDTIARELRAVAAVMDFIDETPNRALGPIPDVEEELAQLAVDGAVLSPLGLHRVALLLNSSRTLAAELEAREHRDPDLDRLVERLPSHRALEEKIERCVDESGQVLSSASRALARLRDRLRGAHSKIVRRLEQYLGTLSERHVVPDASITIRDGRYVIPVRREGRGEVGGIVHDESQTGATLYVEPPMAIEAMNELRALERDEAREVRRVLGELTDLVSPYVADLVSAYDALGEFDSLYGRARSALAWRGTPPRVESDCLLDLREARHPLLVEVAEAPVIPYDLRLESGESCLVVSGPNTGGKSVFLKATGLIAALAQSGVVPPVGAGTTLPIYAAFFADIGDEQSIARNLSTFSAHLTNLSDLVARADRRSLVLIDEMGTGTDPAEGAALSRAVLEELVAVGATTIVSSHLGELKRLDTEGSGIVNASLQFDSEQMKPTYRLVKGRPGRSYGLAIARRLGFPGHVLDRAEAYREDGAAQMEDVLERLERQEREAELRAHELDTTRARTDLLRREVEGRERSLNESERTAEARARDEARRLLLEARAEVEQAIRRLEASVQEGRAFEEAATEARRAVEVAARRHKGRPRGRKGGGAVAPVTQGDRVRVQATGARGRLVEVRADRALVEVGAMRLEVALTDVERIDDAPEAAEGGVHRGGGWTGPPRGDVRIEIDLRGLRVDEMELQLERGLDQAILEGLAELRIIHGKGTGALRKRVGEILETDPRVRGFRMGGPTEGGAGVTVARFGGAD